MLINLTLKSIFKYLPLSLLKRIICWQLPVKLAIVNIQQSIAERIKDLNYSYKAA